MRVQSPSNVLLSLGTAEAVPDAGGNMGNIALAAAFLAASDGGGVVNMAHLLHGPGREYQKMGKVVIARRI